MKKIFYITFLLFFCAFVACKKERVTYDGDPVIEFKPVAITLAKGTAATPGTATVTIQLVGPHQSSAINVPFDVLTESTATKGTHYTQAAAENVIQIPANASKGTLVLTAIPANVPAAGVVLKLKLKNGATTGVSSNYSVCTVTIR